MARPDRASFEARVPGMETDFTHNRDEALISVMEMLLSITPPIGTARERARMQKLLDRMDLDLGNRWEGVKRRNNVT